MSDRSNHPHVAFPSGSVPLSGSIPSAGSDAMRSAGVGGTAVLTAVAPPDAVPDDAGADASPLDSLAPYLERLKAGDREAVDVLFSRYFERVVRVAERRLAGRRQRAAGAEDVAADVFEALWRLAADGSFAPGDLADRDGLWRLLCCLARRKADDLTRHETAQKRGGGKVRGDSIFAGQGDDSDRGAGFDSFDGAGFTPAELVAFADEHRRLMAALEDETLSEVVTLRLEGHTVDDIALRFDRTDRWVKRKLALIRDIWSQQLKRAGGRRGDGEA